jgi:nucleoside-diphosphate-sugar epimerase
MEINKYINSMIKILITGGAGNVGSELTNRLLQLQQFDIYVIDNLITGNIKNLPIDNNKNLTFIEGDVNNYNVISKLMHENEFEYVFHYAALVGVKRTLDNPISVLNDIDGIKNILNLSIETNVKKIFYSSSSEVYGEPVEFPQNEDTTPLNSKLPYAIVKNIGEAFFRSYYKEHTLNYTIFRFFNTYGPNQSKDFVVSKFISNAINNEPIYINGKGDQTRTFCYIDDNIDTTINILQNNLYNATTLNIGNNIEVSVLELANLIIKNTNSKSKIVHLPPLFEGDMTRRLPDISKMRFILNRDLINIEDGIKKILLTKKI